LEQLGILSLLCFIWAGRTLLGFCLLTCTFISLFSSGSGRTQQQFQPCKQALPVGCYFFETLRLMKKILTFLYLTSTIFFIGGVTMTFYDYCYQGYYTNKMINWIWLVLTISIIVLYWKIKFVRIFFFSLLTLIVLSILPMAFPFVGIVKYFTTIDDYQQIKINEKYRLEVTEQQPISMTRIYIYQKSGLLEKNIYRTPYDDIIKNTIGKEPYSLNLKGRNIPIQSIKFISSNNDSLGIEYQILDLKAVFYHKFKDDGY
jgi:hypothetical protein